MFRNAIRRLALAAMILVSASCNYDATAYSQGPTDPVANEGVWLASGLTPALLRLDGTQLLGTGQAVAATAVTSPAGTLSTLNSIAFDDAGTLWVASMDDSLLLGYLASTLRTSGTHAPDRVIASASRSLSAPIAIAFDDHGRLWVANQESGRLVRFSPAQLAAGGAPVPDVIIDDVLHPTALAFDPAGSLWVADSAARRLSSFSPLQIAASSGHVVPQAVVNVRAGNGTIASVTGLAFDAAGTLWVSNISDASIDGLRPAQLAQSALVSPAVRISSAAGAPAELRTGLAFDARGSLWVASGGGSLARFDRADLVTSGARAPRAQLQPNAGSLLWGVAFWPKVAGLPLH